jgi:hypothetical protein
MPLNELTAIASLVLALITGLGTWMFKVHAKLAVIATKLVDVADKLERVAADNHELWGISCRHEARLERHDVELSHLTE